MKKLLLLPLLLVTCFGFTQNAKEIIGKPIRLQKFDVAQYDFIEEMNWKDAKAECAKLGKGWRLPTLNELNVMYKYKDKIGGVAANFYWSSTETGNGSAWRQYFNTGVQYGCFKYFTSYVRAVRAF